MDQNCCIPYNIQDIVKLQQLFWAISQAKAVALVMFLQAVLSDFP